MLLTRTVSHGRLTTKAISLMLASLLSVSVCMPAFADEVPEETDAVSGQEAPAPEVVLDGVTFMQPSAEVLELLRVDGEPSELYVSVDKHVGDVVTPLMMAKRWTPDTAAQAGTFVARIITLNLKATVAKCFDRSTYYTIRVSETPDASDAQSFDCYPIFAELAGQSGSLMGIRTVRYDADADIDERMSVPSLGAGEMFYVFDGDTPQAYRLDMQNGRDYRFDEQTHSYIVSYASVETEDGRVSGSVKYVDLDSGEVVKTEQPQLSVDGDTVITLPDTLTGTDGARYRVVSNLAGRITLNAKTNASASVNVRKIADADTSGDSASAYTAKIDYVELERTTAADGSTVYTVATDENGKRKLLWSDSVDVLNGSYTYSLPHSFSMSSQQGVELYTFESVTAPSDMAMIEIAGHPTAHVIDLDYGKLSAQARADMDGSDLTVTVGYLPARADNTVTFTVTEIDGSTGKSMGTKTLTVTPEEAQTYDPVAEAAKYEGYVPWSGNADPMTFSWAAMADESTLLNQPVYYVPEDYVPGDAYTVTVQYQDIRTGRVVGTRSYEVSPEDRQTVNILGPDTLTGPDGAVYVRLDGQSAPIKHAYPSSARSYTIYYRNINDTLNANTVIRRTEIIDTYRTVEIPGTVTAVPVAAGAAGEGGVATGAVDAGVSQGLGTVVINDNDNPLANADGVATAEERISDDFNPLAGVDGGLGTDGSSASAFSPFSDVWSALRFGVIGAAALGVILLAVFLILKRRKNDDETQAQA